MAQITWRNVDAPDFNEASTILGQAGESFSGGLDALQRTVDRHQTRTKEANTQAFLDQVARMSPEELRTARNDGSLEALRQAAGPLNWEQSNATAVDGLLQGKWGLRQETATQDLSAFTRDFAAGADPRAENSTQLRARFFDQAPTNADPVQLQAAWDAIGASLAAQRQAAPGDASIQDNVLAQAEHNLKLDKNLFHQPEGYNAEEAIQETLDYYTTEDDDGNKFFLGENDSERRKDMMSQMRRLMTSGVYDEDSGQWLEVPPALVRQMVGSVKDASWAWDSYHDLEKEVANELRKPDIQQQYQNYMDYQRFKSGLSRNLYDLLLKGERPTAPTERPLPQEAPPKPEPVDTVDRTLNTGLIRRNPEERGTRPLPGRFPEPK